MNDWRNIPVGQADIGSKLTTVRIRNALKRLGYSSMGEVVDAWYRGSFEESLRKLDLDPLGSNFGKKSRAELMAWISTHAPPLDAGRKGDIMEDQQQEFEDIRIAQSRGPSVSATARRIATTQYEIKGRSGLMALDLWETPGGALIAVSEAAMGGGQPDTRATVVQIGEPDLCKPWVVWAGDEMSQRYHVLEAFAWDQRAMKMVRQQLGWRFTVEVD